MLITIIFFLTVPPYGNITIKSSFGQHDIERIVMAISNASNVIGRFRKGEYRCYKDGFLTETECQEHYSLTVNASGDIIIVMRNISDPYFGSYLISVYRKSDDKIDTLWIKVYKKGKLSTFSRTLEYVIWAVSRGCNRRLTYILFLQNFYCETRAQLQLFQRYPCHMSHIHIQKITSPPRRISPVNSSLRVTVQ